MSQPKCLIEGCNRPAATDRMIRGLCLVCYSKAECAVSSGKTTWEELVSLGLARAELDPFWTALNKVKRGI